MLSAVATAGYFIYKAYRGQQLKMREKISGQWGNEGDVVWSKYETHFIDLSLTVDKDDGEITGIIKCQKVKSEDSLPDLSVNGKLNYRSAILRLTHVRHGEVLVYGEVKIKFKGKLLHWKLKKGIDNFFPAKTKLHRHFTR